MRAGSGSSGRPPVAAAAATEPLPAGRADTAATTATPEPTASERQDDGDLAPASGPAPDPAQAAVHSDHGETEPQLREWVLVGGDGVPHSSSFDADDVVHIAATANRYMIPQSVPPVASSLERPGERVPSGASAVRCRSGRKEEGHVCLSY